MKAIQESNINEKGYAFIEDELNRYSKLKECIRKQIKSPLSCDKKKIFIECGCQEYRIIHKWWKSNAFNSQNMQKSKNKNSYSADKKLVRSIHCAKVQSVVLIW